MIDCLPNVGRQSGSDESRGELVEMFRSVHGSGHRRDVFDTAPRLKLVVLRHVVDTSQTYPRQQQQHTVVCLMLYLQINEHKILANL